MSFETFLLIYRGISKVHVCLLLIDHKMQLITLYDATLEMENVCRMGKRLEKPTQT